MLEQEQVRIVSITFAILAGAILLSAGVAAIVMGIGAPEMIRLPFRIFCHGIASRSIEIAGTPMPICARCTGIYAGMLCAALMWLIRGWSQRIGVAGWVAVLMIIPLAIDGTTQAAGLRESVNALRLLTGFLAGAGAIGWVMTVVARGTEAAPRKCSAFPGGGDPGSA